MSARDDLAELCLSYLKPPTFSGGSWTLNPEALADAILAAGWRSPARQISTLAELEALPAGTVIRSKLGTIGCRFDAERGVVFGDERPFIWSLLALPVTVLFEGGA